MFDQGWDEKQSQADGKVEKDRVTGGRCGTSVRDLRRLIVSYFKELGGGWLVLRPKNKPRDGGRKKKERKKKENRHQSCSLANQFHVVPEGMSSFVGFV